MLSPTQAPLRLCADPAEFVEASEDWTADRPFPVLAGPELDRYAALFGAAGLPAVHADERPGEVVSTGGELSRAAGSLLSAATGRPHRHVPVGRVREVLSELPDRLVALVALAEDLEDLDDWPGTTGALVGVLTARTATALSCLVYRSVTAAPAEERVFIATHPMFRSSVEADAVDMAGLAQTRSHRPKVLVLRGQGRECTFSLLDNMICGRSDLPDRALPIVPGLRATPCMHGEGCFRTDLEPGDLMPANSVHAELVFTHSCSSIAVGVRAYPDEIALSLGLLEGTAVAVIGVLGVHVAQRGTQQDLEQALREGLPLGEVVKRLQERAFPLSGDLQRFGLLGDPALVLGWADRDAVTAQPPGTDRRRRAYDHAAIRRLAHADQVLLRLERLRWLDLDVEEDGLTALRRRVRLAAREPYSACTGPEAARIGEELVELQERVLTRLIDEIYTQGWAFGASANVGMRQVAREDAECPNCRRPRAARLLLRHVVDEELYFQTLQCRRCGDVWWTTEPGRRSIALDGPVDVAGARGGTVTIERLLTNRGTEERLGVVGYALRSRKLHGLPPGRVERLRVPAGASAPFRAELDLARSWPRADTHTTPFVALFDGVHLASMAMLRLV